MQNLLVVASFVLVAGCGHDSPPPDTVRREVVPVGPVLARPLSVTEADADPLPPPPSCARENEREAHLTAAWPEGDRVFYCVETAPDEFQAGVPPTCSSVGKLGDYRAEASRTGKPPPLPTVPLRRESADGRLTFRIEGGLREPKRATGRLDQRAPKKTLKRAAIAYDEHIAFEGWIGQAIVFRTWVDEGPGCNWGMVDPQKTWPSGVDYEKAVSLGGCYGTNYTLKPMPEEYAIVDAGGSMVTFVNETTLATSTVETERQGGPEMGTAIVPWLEGDVLVLVYGAPLSGDVVRVSLKTKSLTSAFTPRTCAPKKP